MKRRDRRLRELDFLRGVAIILVLFRHFPINKFLMNMGWIGVDLFFVLSGFLVSGLLYREYDKNGTIKTSRFLIRRGFKIYPLYYLSYCLYIIPVLITGKFSLIYFLADLLFVQNYINPLGYVFHVGWSLAVEEHFYFGIALLFPFILKSSYFKHSFEKDNERYLKRFERIALMIMLFCLVFRFISNLMFPDEIYRNFAMTHLRMDSLLAGILLSHIYRYRYETLVAIFKRYEKILISIALLGLIWTPFIDPVPSFFVKTIGFTLLYISFSIILGFFIINPNINSKLNSFFTKKAVDFTAIVGFSSYAIYLIHPFINRTIIDARWEYGLYYNEYLYFLIACGASIIMGMLMTFGLESFFLGIRDKFFPSRGGKMTAAPPIPPA